MKFTRRRSLTLAWALAVTLFAGTAWASGSVVKVSLWDKGAASMNMLGQEAMRGMATGPADKNMRAADLGIRVSTHTVPAGEVTFEVTNSSKQLVHEMVVSPVRSTKTPLPYDKAGKVDEDAAGHLGEVSELAPGKKGALRLSLKPGTYILYCNVPGHYALGMWTLLRVKG